MSDPRDVVAAVDVGGTRVKAALVGRPMEVIAELTAPTPYDIDKAFGPAIAEVRLRTRIHRGRSSWSRPACGLRRRGTGSGR